VLAFCFAAVSNASEPVFPLRAAASGRHLEVCGRALEDGVEKYLVGPPTRHVFDRRW
jgi:hypothetical protein